MFASLLYATTDCNYEIVKAYYNARTGFRILSSNERISSNFDD